MLRSKDGRAKRALLLVLMIGLGVSHCLSADAPPTPQPPTGLEFVADQGFGNGFVRPGDVAVTQKVTLTDNDATDTDDITVTGVVVTNLGTAAAGDFALIEILDGSGAVRGSVAPGGFPVTIAIAGYVIPDDSSDTLQVRCTVAAGAVGRRTIRTQVTIQHGEGALGFIVPFQRVAADTTATTINSCPVANDDAAATNEGTPIWIAVQGNDNDADGDPLTTSWVGVPAKGTATIGPGQAITYNPNGQLEYLSAGEVENVTFDYRIADGDGSCGAVQATVTVAVTGVNDAPIANDDAAVTDEDTAIDINVLNNDADVDHLDVLQVTLLNTGAPYNTVGCVSINPNNTVHFDPCGLYEGLKASQFATFQYTVSDGHGGTDTAVVTVEVTGVNDLPVANDDAANTDEDNAVVIPVLGNDTDVDSALTICQITQPANGVAVIIGNSVRYTPDPNWFGVDTFTYRACDELNGDWATVTVTVASVNDKPVANAGPDQAVDEGTLVTLTGAGSFDVDNDPLTYEWAQTAGPAVTLSDSHAVSPTFVAPFVPSNTDFIFTLTVNDGKGVKVASDPDQVTVTVRNTCTVAPPAPTNLTATAVSGTQVDLTWQDGAITTEDGYRIYRAIAGGAPALVGQAPLNASGFSDTTAACGQLYRYSVTAFNSCGESAPARAPTTATPACGGGTCPTPDAGPDQTSVLADPVYLNGTASTGASLYWWEFLSVPAGSAVPALLPSDTVSAPRFQPTQLGAYTLRLWVRDGTCWQSDDVVVTVLATPPYLVLWNLENGTSGWSRSGAWTLVTGGGCCSGMPSPTHNWSYSHPGAKKKTSSVITPWVNVTGQNVVAVYFWQSLLIGAAGRVTTRVDVAFSSKWTTVWNGAGDTGGIWQKVGPIHVNVPANAKKMRVRFYFSAATASGAAQWCIDNVAVGPWVGPLAALGAMDSLAEPAAVEEPFEVLSVRNTPNPVTDVDTTRFEAMGVGIDQIMVQIFDLSGRVVFDSGWQPNGYDWHLETNDGETLANGIYLYVVTVMGYGGQTVVTEVNKLAVYR